MHIPVLKSEVIDGLSIHPSGTYVDGTFGGGGHAMAILEKLNEKGRLIGIDQDQDAVEHGRTLLAKTNKNVQLVRDNFSSIKSILATLHVEAVDGILLDIGVSSHQLDEGARGFSYMQDATLDMRMDNRQSLTAKEVVNVYSEDALAELIMAYGEEKWARRIARFIVEKRREAPIETTAELVEVIKAAVPAGARQNGPHPAKRTFQALRIEVNHELDVLEGAISQMADVLKPGGRLCIITFHSLEDRIVKNAFRTLENPCTCPPEFPVCVCGKKPIVRVITKKPILPTEEELLANHRAHSAKLRICEKL